MSEIPQQYWGWFEFEVVGKPQPAGSKKGFPIRRKSGAMGVSVTDANPKSKMWKSEVKDAARAVLPDKVFDFPVELRLTFIVKRPKGHYGTGRNSDKLKASAPPYPTTKPDVLKLARAVEDALTGIAWVDDAQIVVEFLQKIYARRGEREHVKVQFRFLS